MDKNDILKFRNSLYEGEVHFTYKKTDGTIRKAVGTLCGKLLPRETPLDTYDVNCIKWNASEADIDEYKLPQHCRVKIAAGILEDVLEHTVSNALATDYGFAAESFTYAKREKKRLPAGIVFYYDIEKSGYRSFNESQLISVE